MPFADQTVYYNYHEATKHLPRRLRIIEAEVRRLNQELSTAEWKLEEAQKELNSFIRVRNTSRPDEPRLTAVTVVIDAEYLDMKINKSAFVKYIAEKIYFDFIEPTRLT